MSEALLSYRSPGRVNLIGDHTDYTGGLVLPMAIDRYTTISGTRTPSKIRLHSQNEPKIIEFELPISSPEKVTPSWGRYVAGVAAEMQNRAQGFEGEISCTIPIGAGLSSSAALEVATALALGDTSTPVERARLCQRAEVRSVGVPCGIMDQSVSLMATQGSALLLDCRDLTTKNIPFDVASSGLELLIIDTQAHHALTDGGYAERRASCESVVAKLGITTLRELSMEQLENSRALLTETEFVRARHAVTEMKRVLECVDALSKSDFTKVGHLINQSHASLRNDYTVSCPELDTAVDAALSAGALGSRMVGGGFGGSAIALIQASKTKETIKLIEKAFSSKGFKAPRFFTSLPSQGAELLSRR